jgi:hypothetical protein
VTAALLSCSDARIDADGAVLLDALSFEADGARVGLLGGFSPLFRLFSRTAVLLRGSVQVLGSDAESAVAWNQLAGGADLARAVDGFGISHCERRAHGAP